jgi:hypothetical protein
MARHILMFRFVPRSGMPGDSVMRPLGIINPKKFLVEVFSGNFDLYPILEW